MGVGSTPGGEQILFAAIILRRKMPVIGPGEYCVPRFAVTVARPHARLASRLLARLCRTGLVARRVSMKGFTSKMLLLLIALGTVGVVSDRGANRVLTTANIRLQYFRRKGPRPHLFRARFAPALDKIHL
jgi:hypothetical protein